jgi:quercetin dioxygenase-like cupin family protein
MMTHSIRLLVVLSATVLLQPGCATDQARQGANGAPIPVTGKELIKTTRSWDGQPLPEYPRGQPEITIRRIIIPAGARLETHSHPVINAGMLLSGQLTVVKEDGRTLQLEAGDPIVELVNTPHYGMNHGKVPAEIVIIYAGVVDRPITVVEPH